MTQTVMIVDDDNDIRESLADALTEEGYLVVQARHGAEALEHLRAAQALPAVILLDLMMPVMDGAEFRERQRHDPHLSTVPVVLITAGVTAKSQAESMDVAACVIKPVKLATLIDTITSVIEGPPT